MTKTEISQLAILGGEPAFKEPLHVGRPNIGNREILIDRINEILDRRWFTNNGPLVQEFESRVANLIGVRHCVAMCNATVALEIAIRAAGLSGEVIIPSFTFVATAHALQWQQITPVFCDVDPQTHAINPQKIECMITPRTTGILAVHVWGNPCDIETLYDIANRHSLKLIFDAAHAIGATYKGRMLGQFGDAEVFSFHATKFINAFEGGAIVTNHDELAEKMRFMRNFGFAGYDQVEYVGINGKMSEVSAAMGLTCLESMEEIIEVNYRNYRNYQEGLADIPGIRLYSFDESEKCNYQYVIVEVDEDLAGMSRDTLVRILHAENVLARRYFFPGVHQMEPYRSYFPHAGLLLPETEKLTQRVMSLPTGTAIDVELLTGICSIVRLAVAHSTEILSKLI